jgi:glycosyltransferase involved in cell wall biosynthesis
MSNAIPAKISVVIPAYKVKNHILQVIGNIGNDVCKIYVVDDCCPDGSGEFVRDNCSDARVAIIRNEINLGVGGAVMAGYRAAIGDGMDIIVKVDGDGQMDPRLIPFFYTPIIEGRADYTKGNRFFDLTNIRRMPFARLFGNAVLSFMAKLSSGYWNIFDPTNGFTAVSARVAAHLPLDKISQRYFFETDMLFRLNTLRAVVTDVPMDAVYGDEKSNLKISRIVGEFMVKHIRNFSKRIFYNYFLRDMTVATFELVAGSMLLGFGILFGLVNWISALHQHTLTPLGTIMLAALTVLTGLQLVLAFLNYDIANVPSQAISRALSPYPAR